MTIGDYEIQVPFVPTSVESVKTIAEFAQYENGQKALDLGSGDGRVVIALAKLGFRTDGYELREELVKKAKGKISDLHLQEKARIIQQNFWDADLSVYDLIFIYGMNSIMARLEEKIQREARPGAKVLSHVFRFPHLSPKKEKNHILLYLIR